MSACAEHLAFVKDSSHGYRPRKPHPANFDWLSKARQAYGIKPMTLAGMGRPSDAGKPDGLKKGERIPDVEAWAERRPFYDNETGQPVNHSTTNLPAPLSVVATPAAVLELRKAIFDRQWHGENAEDKPEVKEKIGAELSREIVRAAVLRLHEQKAQYIGKHIHPILWSAGFRVLYRGQDVSDKQYQAIVRIAAKQPEKYAPLFAA